MAQETQIVPSKPGIVDLAVSVDELKDKAEQFKKLKQELLNKSDYVDISGNKYIKKSGIFQFALAFNLKTEIIKEEKETDERKQNWYAYHFTVRCTAPNGRITEKAGSCSNDESDKEGKPMHTSIHKVRAMAETRASNRAISAMVGSAEVTAEEMNASNGNSKPESKVCTCTPETRVVTPDKRGCSNCQKTLSKIVMQELSK